MPYKLTGYKVFLASPSGLEDEKKAFAKVIEEFNRNEALNRNAVFQIIGFEGIEPPQNIINEEVMTCDYFVLLLHDKLESDRSKSFLNVTSVSEEVFSLAFDCYKKIDFPMKQVVVLFKNILESQLENPDFQLKKVLAFKGKIATEDKIASSNFNSLDDFKSLIQTCLFDWVKNNNSVEQADLMVPQNEPIDAIEDFLNIYPNNAIFGDKETDMKLSQAWKLYEEGKHTEAEIEFSNSLIRDHKENQLINYASFLNDLGQLKKAQIIIDKALYMPNNDRNQSEIARALSIKGILLYNLRQLKEAEELFRKSLAIYENIGLTTVLMLKNYVL